MGERQILPMHTIKTFTMSLTTCFRYTQFQTITLW